MSNSLQPHESQHTRPPCPSPTPGVHSDSRPSSRWCHPAISSSVVPFSSCLQSLPASESFSMSQLFTWGGQSTGVSALLIQWIDYKKGHPQMCPTLCDPLGCNRLLCPCYFPGKNTGVGCHFLFQGIFMTQGSNAHFFCLLHQQVDSLLLSHQILSHQDMKKNKRLGLGGRVWIRSVSKYLQA